MRYAGALLVFAACASAGIYRAASIRRRLRTLASLSGALGILRGEICGRLAELPSALDTVRKSAAPETRPFFSALCEGCGGIGEVPFSEIWADAARQTLHLGGNELAAVERLGCVLGRYDAQLQADALDACRAFLDGAYSLELPGSGAMMRTAAGGGAAIGLMILITLL